MPPKLELGTRENYGRKVGTLLGLWLSWGIPVEEELLGKRSCIRVPKTWL